MLRAAEDFEEATGWSFKFAPRQVGPTRSPAKRQAQRDLLFSHVLPSGRCGVRRIRPAGLSGDGMDGGFHAMEKHINCLSKRGNYSNNPNRVSIASSKAASELLNMKAQNVGLTKIDHTSINNNDPRRDKTIMLI